MGPNLGLRKFSVQFLPTSTLVFGGRRSVGERMSAGGVPKKKSKGIAEEGRIGVGWGRRAP